MITNSLERAKLLMEQNRFKEAEKELQLSLPADPNNPDVFALLSICKSEEKKYKEAEELIKTAISLSPADSFLLYLYARVLFDQDKSKEAENKIREAIQSNPFNADYFGLLSSIYLHKKEWEEGLNYANKGLAISPDNIVCLNLRSTALLKLDKKEESYDTISEALHYNPENASTHTNLGWGLLEKGEHKKALDHFKKALQINSESENAKAGLVEALKARYFFYRLFLKYSFWIGNMKSGAQWGVLIGFYVGFKIVKQVAASNPDLKPFLMPLIFLYILFAISTWIIGPISNLFLRFNVYGKYALTKDEIRSSNFVGASLVLGLLAFAVYLFIPADVFLIAGIFGVSMMIPLSGMLAPVTQKGRLILISYTAGLAIVGIATLIAVIGNSSGDTLSMVYLIGLFLYQWVANAVMSR
jgi:tetratricopeptide (TPR) repeat protein